SSTHGDYSEDSPALLVNQPTATGMEHRDNQCCELHHQSRKDRWTSRDARTTYFGCLHICRAFLTLVDRAMVYLDRTRSADLHHAITWRLVPAALGTG